MQEKRIKRLSDRLQAWREGLSRVVLRSPRREYVVWGLFLGLSVFFLWSAISGPQGAVELMRLKGSLQELEERNRVLMHENQKLEKEIYLLRNSPAYQEKVAREGYGYIYPGENVFTFSKPSPGAKKEGAEEGGGREGPSDP